MKKFLLLFFSVFSLSLAVPTISFADHHESHVTTDVVEQHNHKDKESHNHTTTEEKVGHDAHGGPAAWAIIPFALLLLMIATGPLFFEHFWHKNYPAVAIGLNSFIS